MSLAALIGAAACLAVCGYALRKGGAPERVAALALLVAAAAVPLVQDRIHWRDPQLRFALLDTALFAVMARLLSTTRRRWVVAAAALQMIAAATSLLHSLEPEVGARSYVTLDFGLGYAVLSTLVMGTWQVARTRRRQRV